MNPSPETWTFYVVRSQPGPGLSWWPVDMTAIPNTYESYPKMYMTRWRAEKRAAELLKEMTESSPNTEVKIAEAVLTPPEK